MTLEAQTFHSLLFCHASLDSENTFTVALCLKEIVSRDLLVQVAHSDLLTLQSKVKINSQMKYDNSDL
jgi:hypothetical protein